MLIRESSGLNNNAFGAGFSIPLQSVENIIIKQNRTNFKNKTKQKVKRAEKNLFSFIFKIKNNC